MLVEGYQHVVTIACSSCGTHELQRRSECIASSGRCLAFWLPSMFPVGRDFVQIKEMSPVDPLYCGHCFLCIVAANNRHPHAKAVRQNSTLPERCKKDMSRGWCTGSQLSQYDADSH